jgi:hypothetical protein
MAGRDEKTVSRAEHVPRAIEVNLKATFDNVSDMSSCAPIRFNRFACKFSKTNLPAVLFVHFEADSYARRMPVQGLEVDSVRVHFYAPYEGSRTSQAIVPSDLRVCYEYREAIFFLRKGWTKRYGPVSETEYDYGSMGGLVRHSFHLEQGWSIREH